MIRPIASALLVSLLAFTSVAFAAPDTNPANLPAGNYVLDKTHASITAKVMHQGFSLYVFRFNKFDAGFGYDPKNPEASKVQVTIDTQSMSTGWEKADKQFPAEFIKADKFPQATFTSTSIKTTTGNKGTMSGNLTLAGVTKPVTLDVTFYGSGKGMMGETRTGFAATTTIKRSEFGADRYVPMIGDDVALEIEVEFTKK
ncbi:polyisoprenoid-binding protein [Moraxellaceae bacterium AER2_44_116]|jgi:polyisoprenoid-binding protein YceI|nr:YceI family protein [Moraxellaceae bacterium]TQC98173.1 polyisoprenoid-binding protein [Moraxellaceae bacterium AER2_44_116]